MKKIGIIGIGNLLRKDDGIGIILLQQVQKKKFPATVECLDGGIGGMNLLHVLPRYESVIIIDAVDFHGTPGEWRYVSLQDIRRKKEIIPASTHETDFLNVLRLSEELQELPAHVFIFAVQPKDMTVGTTLSEELTSKLDTLELNLQKKIQERIKAKKL